MADSGKWTSEQEESRLREALAQPWWRLNFPSELEQAFDASVASIQALHVRYNLILGLVLYDLFAFGDYLFLPDVYTTAWFIRFAIVSPMLLILVWSGFFDKKIRWRDLAVMAMMLVVTTSLVYPVAISKSPDAQHYHLGLLLVVLFGNLLLGMRFAVAALSSLLVLILYGLELTVWLRLPSHVSAHYIMIALSIMILSLAANHRREWYLRRNFLIMALLEIASQSQLEANARLQRLADRDPLTGLANRRRFDEEYPRLWKDARRTGQPLAVLFIDIDHFKAFNDTYGHALGDDALKQLASLLQDTTARRPLDLAVRNGGEEFLIVLPNTSPELAVEIAQRLLAQLAALAIPHVSSSHGILTASIGVAGGTPGVMQTPLLYVEQADHAMYRAKRNGRNRVEQHKE